MTRRRRHDVRLSIEAHLDEAQHPIRDEGGGDLDRPTRPVVVLEGGLGPHGDPGVSVTLELVAGHGRGASATDEDVGTCVPADVRCRHDAVVVDRSRRRRRRGPLDSDWIGRTVAGGDVRGHAEPSRFRVGIDHEPRFRREHGQLKAVALDAESRHRGRCSRRLDGRYRERLPLSRGQQCVGVGGAAVGGREGPAERNRILPPVQGQKRRSGGARCCSGVVERDSRGWQRRNRPSVPGDLEACRDRGGTGSGRRLGVRSLPKGREGADHEGMPKARDRGRRLPAKADRIRVSSGGELRLAESSRCRAGVVEGQGRGLRDRVAVAAHPVSAFGRSGAQALRFVRGQLYVIVVGRQDSIGVFPSVPPGGCAPAQPDGVRLCLCTKVRGRLPRAWLRALVLECGRVARQGRQLGPVPLHGQGGGPCAVRQAPGEREQVCAIAAGLQLLRGGPGRIVDPHELVGRPTPRGKDGRHGDRGDRRRDGHGPPVPPDQTAG
ncbi:hypothetical protein AKJ08_2087 [Vulgatibacter incomptus]|uniref:Uncharacterized protein n=1 Tax=Vulgatibacter incomptus TaxID=1391653 RepID=A0A0K1PDV2_9BACT|nr:hypothetical protein AKJ08_2087 [Vulgatibacter incomptus]